MTIGKLKANTSLKIKPGTLHKLKPQKTAINSN
jgi:hypothetical protein